MYGPTNVNSRANSDLLSIRMIADNVALSPEQRMARIVEVAREYAGSVEGSGFGHLLAVHGDRFGVAPIGH